MTKQIRFAMLLAGLLVLISLPAAAQDMDWFAQADTVGGCSTAVGHTGWIEINAIHHLWFSPEAQQTTPMKREFIITRRMDCSSVGFWEALRLQTNINEFRLEGVDSVVPYRLRQVIRLFDVRVNSIETADDFPDAPYERVRLSYERVEFESMCYDQLGDPCGSYIYEYNFTNPAK